MTLNSSMPVDLLDRYAGISFVPLEEDEVPGNFPLARWNAQSARYWRYWMHITGEFWNETIPNGKDKNGDPVLRWPLKINYIRTTTEKQAAVLIGETPDTVSPLVPIRITAKKSDMDSKPDETQRKQGAQATMFVNDVW